MLILCVGGDWELSIGSFVDSRTVMKYDASNEVVTGAGIATGYGLDGPGSISAVQDFPLLHSVQTDSGTHPASYPMGTGGSFPGGKAVGAWSWPLTSS
jgi:hypothetical protein